MNKIPKGSYGYTAAHRKRQILKTFVLFLLPAAVFVIGFVTTGTKMNYFTVIAIVGVLPACKEAVNVIMFMRLHSIPRELYETVEEHAGALGRGYELVLTTYRVNYPIDCFVVRGTDIVGYSSREIDKKALDEHITSTMKYNNVKGVHVHVFTDLKAFLERVDVLAAKGPDDTVFSGDERYDGMRREDVVRTVLLALSL